VSDIAVRLKDIDALSEHGVKKIKPLRDDVQKWWTASNINPAVAKVCNGPSIVKTEKLLILIKTTTIVHIIMHQPLA
jgi:hypothetical protein